MPRDDRSYSQAMRDYDAEKKFLRKMRHRAFHPDADSPVIFQLAGYFIRFVIILVVLGAILFLRNSKYFNGEGFTNEVQLEMDHYLGGENSEMEKVFWKSGDQLLTTYKGTGGPHAFFRSIDLRRVAAKASWRDLLLDNGWKLDEVEIGEAHLMLKAGPSLEASEGKPDRRRSSSWFSATPDFSKTRFGEISIHEANFNWGPIWTSKGGLIHSSATIKRTLGDWKLVLTGGVFSQNWLNNLKMAPGASLNVSIDDDKLHITDGEFTLGNAGRVNISGFVQLGEIPEYNFQVSMKTIDLVDIIPEAFQPHLGGLADLELQVTGSPNRSDGIVFEGEMVMVEGGRLREMPILTTLSVITPRSEMRSMPIRSGSRLKFKTRQGVLTVSSITIQGGGAAVGVTGFKRDDGEVLNYARMLGNFSYQMDTTKLDKSLTLDSIKKPLEEDLEEEGPEVGFRGSVRIGMPWELLGKEESYRAKHFTQDNAGYGWIAIPIKGSLDEITVDQAKALDVEWGELAKKARTSFD